MRTAPPGFPLPLHSIALRPSGAQQASPLAAGAAATKERQEQVVPVPPKKATQRTERCRSSRLPPPAVTLTKAFRRSCQVLKFFPAFVQLHGVLRVPPRAARASLARRNEGAKENSARARFGSDYLAAGKGARSPDRPRGSQLVRGTRSAREKKRRSPQQPPPWLPPQPLRKKFPDVTALARFPASLPLRRLEAWAGSLDAVPAPGLPLPNAGWLQRGATKLASGRAGSLCRCQAG